MKNFVSRGSKTHFLTILVVAGFVIGSAALTIMPQEALALRVTMKRIIFEGPKRTELITIINNSTEERAYRLGWRRMRMTEDRSLVYVEDDDPAEDLRPAAEMIRYAPRRIVLSPGASQQVRLMLRRPKDLEPGEYRSHFWIQPEVEAVKFTADEKESSKGRPSVQIKMLTGITLPVIVRAGKMEAAGEITDAALTQVADKLQASFTLRRTGNRSLYGDFDFFCSGGAGGEKLHKTIRGLAVYTDVDKRFLEFKMRLPAEGGAAACSNMRIVYRAVEDDPLFKGGEIARATAALR